MARARENSEAATINLTPMIDVVFLLVIFFMVGAKFQEAESQIKVNLPTASASGAMTRGPDSRVVSIAADGRVMLDDAEVTLSQLTQMLSDAAGDYPDLQVRVRGDASMSHQSFIDTLHAVQTAGVTRIGIASQSGSSSAMRR